MPRFSANLSMLYPEHDFLDRFAAAAADGFEAVEYVGAYDYPPDEVAGLLRAHGLAQVLFNLPAGDWAAGERGIACHPGREEEFEAGVEQALAYARATGCRQVNCLAGIAPADLPRPRLAETLVANLRRAAARLGEAGIKLLLEPINQRDMPGFLISTTAEAEQVFAAVGSDNLYLQFDFYHVQVMQGDLIPTFSRLQPRIAHVQVADTPGRHEPGSGEINYPVIFETLDRLGYDGWVGAEYRPVAGTSAGLAWLRRAQKRL